MDARWTLINLLFNRKGEVWRIPSQGGQAQSLGIPSHTRSATISVHPDGRRIAFTDGELVPEVWVMENFLPPMKTVR